MKEKRINLQEIKVKSFVIKVERQQSIKGGSMLRGCDDGGGPGIQSYVGGHC